MYWRGVYTRARGPSIGRPIPAVAIGYATGIDRTRGAAVDDQGRAAEPAPEEPVTTGDWIRGIIVVVGITVLGIAGSIWVLVNLVFGCGCTRLAPGY